MRLLPCYACIQSRSGDLDFKPVKLSCRSLCRRVVDGVTISDGVTLLGYQVPFHSSLNLLFFNFLVTVWGKRNLLTLAVTLRDVQQCDNHLLWLFCLSDTPVGRHCGFLPVPRGVSFAPSTTKETGNCPRGGGNPAITVDAGTETKLSLSLVKDILPLTFT